MDNFSTRILYLGKYGEPNTPDLEPIKILVQLCKNALDTEKYYAYILLTSVVPQLIERGYAQKLDNDLYFPEAIKACEDINAVNDFINDMFSNIDLEIRNYHILDLFLFTVRGSYENKKARGTTRKNRMYPRGK